MILHDFKCSDHGYFTAMTEYSDELGRALPRPCPECAILCDRVFLPRGWQHAAIESGERTVYYQNAKGEIRIPGRNDVPVPPKLAAMGYEKRECTSISDVVRLERAAGRISERLNYDPGSSSRRPDGVDVDK